MASKRDAVSKAERAFKLFDKDNDGFITIEEFQQISKKLNKQQVHKNFCIDAESLYSFDYILTPRLLDYPYTGFLDTKVL